MVILSIDGGRDALRPRWISRGAAVGDKALAAGWPRVAEGANGGRCADWRQLRQAPTELLLQFPAGRPWPSSSQRHSRDVTRQHEHVSWCTAVTHTAARAAIIATSVPTVTIRSNRSTGPDCTACTASNKISQQPIRLCTPHMVIGPACTYTRLASRRPESRLAMWEEVRHHCPLIRLCALLGYGCCLLYTSPSPRDRG